MLKRSSWSPKVNKPKLRNLEAKQHQIADADEISVSVHVDGNNNAQIAPMAETSKAHRGRGKSADRSKTVAQGVKTKSVQEEADFVGVGLRDLEDEFFQEGHEDHEVSYNQESDSGSEACDTADQESDISGSEVVILQKSQEEIRRQQEEEIKALAGNPFMQQVLENIVQK